MLFLYKDCVEEIRQALENAMMVDNYNTMKSKAILASKDFLYSEIARRSIE